jgi:hypothetical protein
LSRTHLKFGFFRFDLTTKLPVASETFVWDRGGVAVCGPRGLVHYADKAGFCAPVPLYGGPGFAYAVGWSGWLDGFIAVQERKGGGWKGVAQGHLSLTACFQPLTRGCGISELFGHGQGELRAEV